jgi:hypothetical protein
VREARSEDESADGRERSRVAPEQFVASTELAEFVPHPAMRRASLTMLATVLVLAAVGSLVGGASAGGASAPNRQMIGVIARRAAQPYSTEPTKREAVASLLPAPARVGPVWIADRLGQCCGVTPEPFDDGIRASAARSRSSSSAGRSSGSWLKTSCTR